MLYYNTLHTTLGNTSSGSSEENNSTSVASTRFDIEDIMPIEVITKIHTSDDEQRPMFIVHSIEG